MAIKNARKALVSSSRLYNFNQSPKLIDHNNVHVITTINTVLNKVNCYVQHLLGVFVLNAYDAARKFESFFFTNTC